MSSVESITIGRDEAEQRLDRWFKRRFPELTHGRLEKLLRTGQVRVDGKRIKANHRLEPGQVVRVPPLTVAWWLSMGCAKRSITDPHAPVLGSLAPNTRRAMRAFRMAPAHIGHGSSVTYSSHPGNR